LTTDPDDHDLLDDLMAAEGVRSYGAQRRGGGPAGRTHRQGPAPTAATPSQPRAETSDERDATSSALARAQAELDATRRALASTQAELAATRRSLDDTAAQRDAFDKERRALARARQAIKRPEPPDAVLRETLTARGLAAAEHATVLAALLRADPDRTLDALERPTQLAALLDDRLVLACTACAPEFGPDVAVFTVTAPRCERCGGSDTTAAWHCFADACAKTQIHRVVIIGGSPAYRQVLRVLAAQTGPRLDLVDGRRQPRARRVKTQARTADLVVAWGGTIVDHATTNAYAATGVRVVQVPHRGIGTMLRWLTGQLA